MSPAESSTDAFSSVLPEPTCASEPLHLYVRFGYASPRHQTSPQWVENPKWDANGTGMLDILEMESIHHGRQPLLFLFKFKVPKTMLRLLRRMMQNAKTRSILCRKVIEDFIVTLSHRHCCVGGKCQPCMHGLSAGVKFVLDEPSLGPNHFHTPEIYLNMIRSLKPTKRDVEGLLIQGVSTKSEVKLAPGQQTSRNATIRKSWVDM